MENKKEFVKNYGELLAKHGIQNIAKMEYIQDGYEEYAEITYQNGFTKRVCITADSLWCILVDTVHSL